jgi:MFS transporter, PPP family, 3-phenylpropionic acid transporter
MAYASSISVLAATQVLHALTFAATHLGAMHHLARTIPPERGATGQAVYGAVVGGIGPGFLLLLAGAAYGAAGGLAYLAMAGLAGAGAIVALALSARNPD